MYVDLLAFGMPGFWELIVLAILFGLGCVVPVLVVLYVIRMLIRNKQENQRLRMEVGKLADELEQLRKRGSAASASTTGQ